MNLFGLMTVYADGEEQAAAAAQGMNGNSILTMVIYIVAMVAIFYFLLIRPQKKRDKESKLMMESLKVGDKVVTIGGIYGKITQLKEDTLVIETGATGNTCTIKISRSAIREVLTVKD